MSNNHIRIYYIYLITNLINGKTYVGQRYCPINRTPETDKYMGSGIHIKSSMKKYGRENFRKDILAVTAVKDVVDILERQYIFLYRGIGKAEYNHANGGEGGHGNLTEEQKERLRMVHVGRKRSEETRKKLSDIHKNRPPEWNKKLSESHKGKKYGSRPEEWKQNISKGIRNSKAWHDAMRSDERRRKLSETHKGKPSWNKGMKMSEEWCKNMSESRKAFYASPEGKEAREKIKKARKKQVITEETKRKMSEAHKGKVVTEEHRKHLSEALKGHKISEETRAKIREARKKQQFSRESIEKRKASLAKYWESKKLQSRSELI